VPGAPSRSCGFVSAIAPARVDQPLFSLRRAAGIEPALIELPQRRRPIQILSQSFSTTFSLTESPISEGGAWTNSGLGQTNINTSSGLAVGTYNVVGGGPTGDSAAILTGTWPADVTVSVTIHKASGTESFQEAEILLRAAAGASAIRGYEVFVEQGGLYLDMVRRNGTNGGVEDTDYTFLVKNHALGLTPADGDVFSATIIGNTVTAKWNGSTIWTHDISIKHDGTTGLSTYNSGSVGIGYDGATGSFTPDPSKWCFTDFSVAPAP
jgi:hypothetical protein